jgi:signal transduction histidine kinase
MIEINKQETDFAMTFEGHCQMGWGTHQKEGVRYITENHYNRLVVNIDDTNMGRIIEQVVTNAAQHTHTGTVRARYDYINGKLMIAVDDTGNGMSEETLSHVYERFSTGKNGGTGLGLPICKELTEQMGGSIDISSEEGKGTTVWIIMPCKATVIDRKKEI